MKNVLLVGLAMGLFLVGCDGAAIDEAEVANSAGSCYYGANDHILDVDVGFDEVSTTCQGQYVNSYARYEFFPTQPFSGWPAKMTVTANNNQPFMSNHILWEYDLSTYQWSIIADVTVGPPGTSAKQEVVVGFDYSSSKYYYFSVDYIGSSTPAGGTVFASMYVTFDYP